MKIIRLESILYIFLLSNLPIASAMAGNLSVVINGKSAHINANHDWNENNYGLGLEYQFDTKSRWRKIVMANGFRDSDNNMSYMAGAGLHRRLLQTNRFSEFYFDVGINAFIMTREDVNDNQPFPGALPSLSFGNKYGGFNLTYLPMRAAQKLVGANSKRPAVTGVFFLQFKISLSQLLP